MNPMKFTDIQLLDCTIRDGGYVNNWRFDKRFVREVYRALSKSGVDYIEIGYRGTEKYFNKEQYGQWRFSSEEEIGEVIFNIDGAKLALMADYGRIDLEDFCDAKESAVELIRLAVNKNALKEAVELLEQLKRKGYKVALNVMNFNNISKIEHTELIAMLEGAAIDYIYVVDSYGSLFPHQVKAIIDPLLGIENIKIGFHPHNSLQMAFANTLEAMRCGVHIIDSTIYGIGRAAGNLPSEIIVAFLEKEKKDRYNSIPLLNIIDRCFVSLFNDNRWGYQLPYMLSGMFECHPNYAKKLVDSHEYTIEDVWKAMNYVKANAPSGFSEKVLEELIRDGVMFGLGNNRLKEPGNEGSTKSTYKLNDDHSAVSYVNRHKDRDFLILANGPSLKEYKDRIGKFIAEYDPVILGANYLGDLFRPDYHAFCNKRRFVSYIDTVASGSKLLIGESIPDEMVREYTDKKYERIRYVDALNHRFDIVNGVITTNCRTVAVLLLGVAIAMGARRVFAVGMDGYAQERSSEELHFYDEKDERDDRQSILEMHNWCQRFLEQIDAYLIARDAEGVHILTPTSYRSFYKGVENYI